MKFFLPLMLLLAACSKIDDMPTQPRYSFVRIDGTDYTTAPCVSVPDKCLPITQLGDLRFQFDLGFNQFEPSDNFVIAVPCGVVDSIDDLVGTEQILLDLEVAHVVVAGVTVVQFTVAGLFSTTPVAGQLLFIDAGEGDDRYKGWHYITDVEIDGGETIITTSTVPDGEGTTLTDFPQASIATIPGGIGAENIDDFVWDFNNPVGELSYSAGECLVFCIYKVSLGFEFAYEIVGGTNCFVVIDSNDCYSSKITYDNNEDSFGFYAGVPNSVRVPFFLKNAQFPGEEKGYQKSDGSFVKLSERINKTWEVETDLIPDEWHERLRVALSCDNIEVSNESVGLTDQPVYRSEGYEIDEPIEQFPTYPFRKATTTLFQKQLVASVNSNCV